MSSKKKSLTSATEITAIFHKEFREDLCWWIEKDRSTALKLMKLVEEVIRNPFSGTGKPESLKFELTGCWSRRITQEHRLVYKISGRTIDFLMARYHY